MNDNAEQDNQDQPKNPARDVLPGKSQDKPGYDYRLSPRTNISRGINYYIGKGQDERRALETTCRDCGQISKANSKNNPEISRLFAEAAKIGLAALAEG